MIMIMLIEYDEGHDCCVFRSGVGSRQQAWLLGPCWRGRDQEYGHRRHHHYYHYYLRSYLSSILDILRWFYYTHYGGFTIHITRVLLYILRWFYYTYYNGFTIHITVVLLYILWWFYYTYYDGFTIHITVVSGVGKLRSSDSFGSFTRRSLSCNRHRRLRC